MDSRDTFDLALVVVAGLLAYTETFGFVDPRATIWELVAILLNLDVRVYLLVGGIFGAAFVTYLVVYLPQKDARAVKP
ncbi:hypothetical protein ACFQGE_11385 [Halomicroarcula sp. GCM10025817]|uniref:hypothetical protein n=1 Tax=Haloarcula TaxID=2237 RepID=UPI0023E8DE9A|nr:hypothetical protein [Halomicroarcula sp. SYNS111]